MNIKQTQEWVKSMMEMGFATLSNEKRMGCQQFQSEALHFIANMQPIEPVELETAESELAIIAGELAAIQTALVSCARLMTLPPHLRDQIIITPDGEMELMEGTHPSARDSFLRRNVNVNAG